MKQLFLILSVIFLSSVYCYAREYNDSDSTKVEYQVYGCDTLVTEKYHDMFIRGLKQYSNYIPVNYKGIDPDIINSEINKYLVKEALNFITEIFDGYGKERCKEMLNIFEEVDHAFIFFIQQKINIEGDITCVEFMYIPELSPFMTYEDVKRNTGIIINREPAPFLAKYGIELSPWITTPIIRPFIQKYLEEK